MTVDVSTVRRLLEEAESSGLDLSDLQWNSAKVHLLLDLRALVPGECVLTVLDVGCGPSSPVELWAGASTDRPLSQPRR